jgi:broad specificity phosphatase PhoE
MAGKRVLIVTHAGTIWCIRYVLERWSYDEAERRFRAESIPNASITSYERRSDGHLTLDLAGATFTMKPPPPDVHHR